MEVNTLIRHNKMKCLGIWCVSKMFTLSGKVNVRMKKVIICKGEGALTVIDTSKCKTITVREFQQRILNGKSMLNQCIVGIGLDAFHVVTKDNLTKCSRII